MSLYLHEYNLKTITSFVFISTSFVFIYRMYVYIHNYYVMFICRYIDGVDNLFKLLLNNN